MAAQITGAERDEIVRQLGRNHKPAPEWVTSDPKLDRIYRLAAGMPPTGDQTEPKRTPKPTKPASSSSPRPTRTRRAPRASSAAAARVRAVSRRPASGFVPHAPHTAGGVLLAVFAYPLALAILQYGPAGLTMWLKAKFLNVPADEADLAIYGQTTNPTGKYYVNPGAKPGQPGSGRWPNGKPIPDYPTPGLVPNKPPKNNPNYVPASPQTGGVPGESS